MGNHGDTPSSNTDSSLTQNKKRALVDFFSMHPYFPRYHLADKQNFRQYSYSLLFFAE